MNSAYGKTVSSQRYEDVQTTSFSFIEAIPNRVGLIISSPLVSSITISLDKTAVFGQGGITLHPTTEPLMLSLQEHGDLVSRAWSAISSSGTESISIVEIFASK